MDKFEDAVKKLNACLVIPTYNHASLLGGVLDDCLRYSIDIIVVNDGSTDNTLSVLKKYSHKISIVNCDGKNKGKGYALRQGAKKAKQSGYKAIISIDSDGQHFGSDIESIVNGAMENPDAIIVGSRGLEHENMPRKNTFANKFANFWFRFQTAQHIPDTQSGFRYYPLACFDKKIWFTNRYDFELEILVRNSWRNVKIIPIPIQVYYPPPEERITHFKPSIDFIRISILNTFLSIFAIFYHLPKKFYLFLRKKD